MNNKRVYPKWVGPIFYPKKQVQKHEQEKEQKKMNMNNPFADPGSASGIEWANLNGRLLVIEPKSVETGIKTVHGDKEAVRADVYAIDGTPEEFLDTLIFPGVLIGQTKGKVGEKVLGRLGQGDAKPGQKPPWMIFPASPEDTQAGVAWLNARQASQFQQPQQQQYTQQAQPQQQYPQQAPAPAPQQQQQYTQQAQQQQYAQQPQQQGLPGTQVPQTPPAQQQMAQQAIPQQQPQQQAQQDMGQPPF